MRGGLRQNKQRILRTESVRKTEENSRIKPTKPREISRSSSGDRLCWFRRNSRKTNFSCRKKKLLSFLPNHRPVFPPAAMIPAVIRRNPRSRPGARSPASMFPPGSRSNRAARSAVTEVLQERRKTTVLLSPSDSSSPSLSPLPHFGWGRVAGVRRLTRSEALRCERTEDTLVACQGFVCLFCNYPRAVTAGRSARSRQVEAAAGSAHEQREL